MLLVPLQFQLVLVVHLEPFYGSIARFNIVQSVPFVGIVRR
jgi:hypothetical protein